MNNNLLEIIGAAEKIGCKLATHELKPYIGY